MSQQSIDTLATTNRHRGLITGPVPTLTGDSGVPKRGSTGATRRNHEVSRGVQAPKRVGVTLDPYRIPIPREKGILLGNRTSLHVIGIHKSMLHCLISPIPAPN